MASTRSPSAQVNRVVSVAPDPGTGTGPWPEGSGGRSGCGTLFGMAAQYIYTIRDLRRFYPPDREVLKGINLSFYPGAKIGVIGGNGSGKSSLLRIMAGEDDGFTGEARLTAGFTVGHLSQEPQLDPDKDVLGNVSDGVAETKALVDRFNEVCAAMGQPDADFDQLLGEQAELQDKIDAAGAWDLERTFEIAMDALRLPPGDADVTTLSGGERRRVALCRLLLSKPDLLLLDEPTNHLDAESVAWLERTLQDYPGTVVAVTHDRYFLDNVAGWILELDRGAGIPWEGNYSSWLEQKQARLAGEQKADKSRQEALQRELEWIRMSPAPARARARRASTPTTTWWPRPRRPTLGRTGSRSPSPPGPGSATGWSTPGDWSRGSATGCSSTGCRSCCLPVGSWASSVRTAPARPPCSG